MTLLAALSASTPETKIIQGSLDSSVDWTFSFYRDASQGSDTTIILKNMANGSRTCIRHTDIPDMTFDEFKDVANRISDQTAVYHFEV